MRTSDKACVHITLDRIVETDLDPSVRQLAQEALQELVSIRSDAPVKSLLTETTAVGVPVGGGRQATNAPSIPHPATASLLDPSYSAAPPSTTPRRLSIAMTLTFGVVLLTAGFALGLFVAGGFLGQPASFQPMSADALRFSAAISPISVAEITRTPLVAATSTATPSATSTEQPTSTPLATATPVATSTPTLPPRPTLTTQPTQTPYVAPTATPVPLPVLYAQSNVQVLRTPVDAVTSGNLLVTLPAGSWISLSARSADGQWWRVWYDGSYAWVRAGVWVTAWNLTGLPIIVVATATFAPPTVTITLPPAPSGSNAVCSGAAPGSRYGAICKDGWRSSSTGSGTCSHHGGVLYWLTC